MEASSDNLHCVQSVVSRYSPISALLCALLPQQNVLGFIDLCGQQRGAVLGVGVVDHQQRAVALLDPLWLGALTHAKDEGSFPAGHLLLKAALVGRSEGRLLLLALLLPCWIGLWMGQHS